MEGDRRPVVVHIHLFKNAGTSVDVGLESHFSDAWASHDRTETNQMNNEYLHSWLAEHPGVSAFSSHQIRPPLDGGRTFEFLPIVFLRHPLDRIRSAFDFERKQGSVTPSSAIAANSSFDDWLRFHRERNSAQSSDFHVSALSTLRWPETGGLRRKLPMEQHLESAKQFLAGLPTFGVVEDYERSWQRLAAMVRTRFPSFSPPSATTNTTDGRLPELAERLAQMRQELGDSSYHQLVRENTVDLELHSWAQSVLR